MKKLNWQPIVERGVWTFAQAFLAVLVASGTDYVNVATLQAAGIAGGAALISFLKNVTVQAREKS